MHKNALLIFSIFFTFISTGSFAKERVYVSLGGLLNNTNESHSSMLYNVPTYTSDRKDTHFSRVAPQIEFSVGCDYTFKNKITTGVELFVNLGEVRAGRFENHVIVDPTDDALRYSTRFSVKHGKTVGARLITMWDVYSSVKAFLSLDFMGTEFKIASDGDLGTIGKSHVAFGVAPGAGVQVPFNSNLSGRLGYSYRIYRQFNFDDLSDPADQAKLQFKARPRSHVWKASLIWYF